MKHLYLHLLLSIFTISALHAETDPNKLFRQGMQLYNHGQYEQAIRIFEEGKTQEALLLGEDYPHLYYYDNWIGCSYYQLGDTETAGTYTPEYFFPPVNRELTAESDSLCFLALSYMQLGNPAKALELYQAGAEIEARILGKEHYYYANTLLAISDAWNALMKIENAIETTLEAITIQEKIYPPQSLTLVYGYDKLTEFYYSIGKNETAVDYQYKIYEICTQQLGEEDANSLHYLRKLIEYLVQAGDFENALYYCNKEINLYAKLVGEESIEVGFTMGSLSNIYRTFDKPEEALKIITRSQEILFQHFSEDDPVFIPAYIETGHIYSDLYNLQASFDFFYKAYTIYMENYDEEDLQLTEILDNLGMAYQFIKENDVSKSIELLTESLRIKKKFLKDIDLRVTKSYTFIAQAHRRNSDIPQALQYASELVKIQTTNPWIHNSQKTEGYKIYANILLIAGEFEKALNITLQGINLLQECNCTDSENYATLLTLAALIYSQTGAYPTALKYNREAINVMKEEYIRSNPYAYALMLNTHGLIYQAIGNYEKALQYFNESYNLTYTYLGKQIELATLLNNMAISYSTMGNLSKAIELSSEILNLHMEYSGDNLNGLALAYINLGSYKRLEGEKKEALLLYEKGLEVMKTLYGEDNPYYADALIETILLYIENDEYDKSEQLIKQASAIYEKHLQPNNEKEMNCNLLLGVTYFCKGDYKKAADYYTTAYDKYISFISRNFNILTKSERENTWNIAQALIHDIIKSAFQSDLYTPFVSLSYNASLFAKGLLLNSEIELNKLLLESNEPMVYEIYKQLKETEQQLENLLKQPHTTNSETQQLYKKIEQLEITLLNKSTTYGDYTRNLRITWQDIQTHMHPEDLAIEFTHININQKLMYAALLLKKDWQQPIMIPLFDEWELGELPIQTTTFHNILHSQRQEDRKALYTNEELSNRIWEPLIPYLKEANNIYFSPTGLFHILAIEHLPANDEQAMNEKYNLHRISSTKEIIKSKKEITLANSTIYGGLDYDTTPEEISMTNKKTLYNSTLAYKSDFATLSRDGLLEENITAPPLPGSYAEARAIHNLLSGKYPQDNLVLFTEKTGTEETFKKLPEKKPNLLHIATHGFFINETQATQTKLTFLPPAEGYIQQSYEDKALTRSGLLLAGANHSLSGKTNTAGTEDGILTAKEIATLDLRSLDLVVLSACQTGLGDITGDGVFGLQRGFKKAGAGTLIMSLWKVDDRATEIMMTAFYQNLLEGQTKRQAFINAQQTLKTYIYDYIEDTPSGQITRRIRYDSPAYWAAFILLD